MTNDVIDTNINRNIESIDLVYAYTEDFLKERKDAINKLKLRSGTFLGFAGLLLRFNIDLPDTQPSYLLTKIGALVTSFCSIAILAWALRSNPKALLVNPNSLKENCLQLQTAEIKMMIINIHAKACEELTLVAYKQKEFLNRAITCLVFSALFFAVNGILVSFCGR